MYTPLKMKKLSGEGPRSWAPAMMETDRIAAASFFCFVFRVSACENPNDKQRGGGVRNVRTKCVDSGSRCVPVILLRYCPPVSCPPHPVRPLDVAVWTGRRAAPSMRADEERERMRCDARVVDGGEGGLRVEGWCEGLTVTVGII
jgi:hypothetical protein